MEDSRRLGGIAALLQAAVFVAFFILGLIVLPAAGVDTSSMNDVVKQTSNAVNHQWANTLFGALFVLISAGVLVLSLSLYDRLHDTAPFIARIAAAAGLIATALFLVIAMGAIGQGDSIVRLYRQSHERAFTAVAANNLAGTGYFGAGFLAYAALILLDSWLAMRARALPTALAWVGVGLGLLMVIGPYTPFGWLFVVFIVLFIVWSIWLGVFLVMEPVTAGRPRPAAAVAR